MEQRIKPCDFSKLLNTDERLHEQQEPSSEASSSKVQAGHGKQKEYVASKDAKFPKCLADFMPSKDVEWMVNPDYFNLLCRSDPYFTIHYVPKEEANTEASASPSYSRCIVFWFRQRGQMV